MLISTAAEVLTANTTSSASLVAIDQRGRMVVPEECGCAAMLIPSR